LAAPIWAAGNAMTARLCAIGSGITGAQTA